MSTPLLDVTGLTAGYGDHQPVLHDVSFTLAEGELLGLVGMNGAGKTTLMRALSGGLKPRSGEVSFQGERMNGFSTAASVRKGIVIVPEGHRVLRPLTVEENLQISAMRLSRRAVRRAIAEKQALVYELFPILAERRTQLAGLLSGGEQQMLSLARAVIQRPRLLLLDEPSLGLAPVVIEKIYASLRALQAEGISMLVVEQNSDRLARASERLIVLRDGRIAATGTPSSLQGAELNAAYFG
ncbi:MULTISPECIES: ABC transporter ATP-binding protein [unclassified Streptomyces]|uniref:ABC transporter ATP-binding protein n=1 Tax=unclassified Streptomyces TaxID=2593676 RepID=UPI0033ACFD15